MIFTQENTTDIPILPDRNFNEILCDVDISEEIVYKKLKNLNVTKSPGPDGFHNKLLVMKSRTILQNR